MKQLIAYSDGKIVILQFLLKLDSIFSIFNRLKYTTQKEMKLKKLFLILNMMSQVYVLDKMVIII